MSNASGFSRVARVRMPTLRGYDSPPAANANDTFLTLVTLALCVQWAISATNFSHVQWPIFVILLGCVAAFPAALAGRAVANWAALGLSVAAGVTDRFHRAPFPGSDVVDATREALTVLFSGGNPYYHVFQHSRPAGSPFPYLPGELFFYAVPFRIFHSITRVDQMAGIALIFVIASLAPLAGPARTAISITLFTTFTFVAKLAVDGSNETSLAFLLISAVVAFAWSEEAARRRAPRVQAVLFGLSAMLLTGALLFKALSWFFVPFIVAYVARRGKRHARYYLLALASFTVIALARFVIPSPAGLIENIYAGFVFHQSTWGLNLWDALEGFGAPVERFGRIITVFDLVVVAATFAQFMRKPPATLGAALMYGLATTVPALLLAHWSTAPYFTLATTLLTVAIPLSFLGPASTTREHIANGKVQAH